MGREEEEEGDKDKLDEIQEDEIRACTTHTLRTWCSQPRISYGRHSSMACLILVSFVILLSYTSYVYIVFTNLH